MLAVVLSISALAALVSATPTLQARQAITTLNATERATFRPYTSFAAAAYCDPSTTRTWTCTPCSANAGFQPIATGGDGAAVQFWYVGFDPTSQSIIVAHQGTDTSKIEALATDANLFLAPLDSTLFPGVPSLALAHLGFTSEQAKTATSVLAAVQQGMSQYGTSKVTVVGHSLGGALAMLDAIYLPLHIPGVQLNLITYGCPRVGNEAFANYVDAQLPGSLLARVNNKEDFVPILPDRLLGYHHPSGEKHIMDNNAWVACPGQDNESGKCTTGDVPTILNGNETEHDGPYDGVEITCH